MTLDQWLRENDVTEGDFAKRISSSQPSVNRYRRGRVPEKAPMIAIFRETGGLVTPADFYPELQGIAA